MNDRLTIEREGPLAIVTLARPDKRNAVDWPMLRAWVDAQKQLQQDRELRGVIIRGDGPSFCAGLDFPTFSRQPARIIQGFLQPGGDGTNLFQQACLGWRNLSVPVAAVIQGHCFGAGLQLALACDFRFATPEAQLSIMEIKWGLIPDMSASITLRELIPMDLAKRLCMTGEVFDAPQALQWGLVSEVDAKPEDRARELLERISQGSPDAIAASKHLLQETWMADNAAALAAERKWQRRMLTGRNQRVAMKRNTKRADLPYEPRRKGL